MQTITLDTVIKFIVMVMLLIVFGNAIAAPAANTPITQPSKVFKNSRRPFDTAADFTILPRPQVRPDRFGPG